MLHLIATALLASSQPSPALSPEPSSPLAAPAPANLQREEVLSWMGKYVRGPEWTLLAYDYEGVKLAAPGQVTRSPEGWAEAEVRTELFKPITLKVGVTARSGLASWHVDCEANRFAVLRMTVYAGNNLQGELATKITDGTVWQEPVGSEGETIRAVCKAVGR